MGFKLRTIFVISTMMLGLAYYTGHRFPDSANNPGLKFVSALMINGILTIVSSPGKLHNINQEGCHYN